DVQLQLGLPVDRSVLTGSIQSVDWGAICYDILDTFQEPKNNSTKVERIRYARAYILDIIGVIPDEFFQNSNIWHVKVPLVNYATVEMHQTDRVLRQFGFQQSILVTPEVLNDEHKIDLNQSNTHWLVFFLEYIKIWENRYNHIPTHELIIVPELTCALDYMPWFRIHGKLYFLSKSRGVSKSMLKGNDRTL
ncbi:hypothetical protein Golax_023325, partial [Gossypium laxum]|nr:hypothetical protein [Gossypium laxum]